MAHRSLRVLTELFRSKPVVSLREIRDALDSASRATAFRYLRQLPYRRSYNHNGGYYAVFDPSRYDRHGLFSYGDIHFSRDGTLKATIRRLVRESEEGRTDRELRELLHTRVQPFLLAAIRDGELARQRSGPGYVYFCADPDVGAAQLRLRQERLEAATQSEVEVGDSVVIAVLLVLIRHPGHEPADVARRLQGRSPPIGLRQVRAVFAKYRLGEKGGPSIR